MGWWSWILMGIGTIGLLLAGRKNLWGWAVGLAVQPLWVVYGVLTDQGGFVVGAGVYGGAYALNFIKWWREKPKEVVG